MILRYPGGKSKLLSHIVPHIYEIISKNENILTYCEPFIGSGSITYNVLKKKNHIKKVILNDKDYPLRCLWNSILFDLEDLEEKISNYQPNVVDFFYFKEVLTRNQESLEKESRIDVGFKKLAIHQMSYSGLGTKAGGPIGGKKQTSNYNIACRWNPKNIIKKYRKLKMELLQYNITDEGVTCLDFRDIINGVNGHTIMYLDPPYYIKGKDMYSCSFSEDDHRNLSEILMRTDSKWILSYDNCDYIRNLYKWTTIKEFDAKYYIKTIRNKKEILIFSPNYYI
tara:strand:+ start:138 stop:983 length:846 start_codon:yes stop_codon:yes gene_type:complete